MRFWRHPAFREGAADFAAVAPGIAAWGVMTGVAMVRSGMGIVEVLTMALLVFAGSSQLAALPLIAGGAPSWVVLATSFCVNLRFVVFSIHLRPYVLHHRWLRRVFSGYLMADLNYVLVVRRFPHPPTDPAQAAAVDAYWLGNGLVGWVAWTVPSLIGVALGKSVPEAWGLGFAGILALVGVSASLVTTPLRAVSATVAGAAAIAAYALPLKLNIVVAIAVAVVVCLVGEKATAVRRQVA